MRLFVCCTWMSLPLLRLPQLPPHQTNKPTDHHQTNFFFRKVFRKSFLNMNRRTNLADTKSFFILHYFFFSENHLIRVVPAPNYAWQNKKISFKSIRVGPTIDGTFSEWPHRSAALTLETIAASSDPGCRRGRGGGVTGHTYSDRL